MPHEKLSRDDGAHKSLWDQKTHQGCEVDFVTNDSLLAGRRPPGFGTGEGAELYRLGWRQSHSIEADGPGTGIFGIENGSLLCLVESDRPAYVDDHGNIIASKTLTVAIQCRKK